MCTKVKFCHINTRLNSTVYVKLLRFFLWVNFNFMPWCIYRMLQQIDCRFPMVKIKPVNLVVFSVQNLPMLLLTRLRCLLLPRLLSHLFDGLSAVTDDADQDTSDETVIQWRSQSSDLTIPVIIMNPHPAPKITLVLLLNQYARVSVAAICLLSLLYITGCAVAPALC